MPHDLPRDTGVHLGHLLRFAFEVAEDQRAETGLAHFNRDGFQGLLGAWAISWKWLRVSIGSPGLMVSDAGFCSQLRTHAGVSMP